MEITKNIRKKKKKNSQTKMTPKKHVPSASAPRLPPLGPRRGVLCAVPGHLRAARGVQKKNGEDMVRSEDFTMDL